MKNMWIRMLVHRAVDLFLGLLFVIGDFDFSIKNFWWSVLGSLDLVVVRWCFFIEQNLREIKWGDGRLMFNGDDQLCILGYEETCIFQRKPRDYYFFNYWRQISLVYVNCSMCELQDCFFCNISICCEVGGDCCWFCFWKEFNWR